MAEPISLAIAFVKTAASAWTAWSAKHAIAAAIIKTTVAVAVSSALQSRQKMTDPGSQTSFKADSQAGIDVVLGRTAVAGTLALKYPSGPKNKHLNMIGFLSGCGPIQAVEKFEMNRTEITWNNSTGKPTNDTRFKDRLWLKYALGVLGAAALTQPAQPASDSPLPEWSSAHKMNGFAQFWLDTEYSSEVWTSGMEPLWTVQGVKCYDPRLDSTYPGGSGSCRIDDRSTWVYSENPQIVALTYLLGWHTNGVKVGGCGVSPDLLGIPSFVNGANISTANGWKVGGSFNTLDSKWQTLKAILQAGGAEPISLGAKISCMTYAPKTSLRTLTKDDFVSLSAFPATKSIRDRKNTIIPRYRSEEHNWTFVSAGEVSVSSYVTVDGGRRSKETEFRLVQQAKQAGELAAYELVNARELGPIVVQLKPYCAGFEPGDAVTFNVPEVGLNNQLVLIKNRDIDYQTGIVSLTVESETTSKHAFALGQTDQAPPTTGLTQPDYYDVPAPDAANWDAEAGTDVSGLPSIVIVGSADDYAFASEIIVELRANSGADWSVFTAVPASQTRIEIAGIAGINEYGVAIRYKSVYGKTGPQLVLANVTTGPLVSDDTGNVGGRPAEDLLDDVDQNTTDIAQEIADRIAAINQEIADRTAADTAEAAARAAEITAASNALQANIDSVQAQVNDIIGTPPYDNSTTYNAGDLVVYDDKLYRAKSTTTGNLPTNATYWELVGDYVSLGETVAAHSLAISDLQTNVASNTSGLAAEVSARETLAVQIRGSYTGTDITAVTSGLIYSERQARITSDNVQISNISALQGRMTTAEGNITTQGTAISGLDVRMTTAEGTITTHTSQITTLQNSVASAGSYEAAVKYEFEGSVEGWSGVNATVTSNNGILTVAGTASDPILLSPTFSIQGRDTNLIRLRLRRKTTTGSWDGKVYYSTSGHGETAGYYKQFSQVTNTSFYVLELDMSQLTAGGNDWVNNAITRVRFDFDQSSGGEIEIDWIAFGKQGAGVTSSAISGLDSRITVNAGNISTLSSQTTALTGRMNTAESNITSINGSVSANTSAIATISGQITAINGTLTSQSSSITLLNNRISARRNILPNSTFIKNFDNWNVNYSSGLGTIVFNRGFGDAWGNFILWNGSAIGNGSQNVLVSSNYFQVYANQQYTISGDFIHVNNGSGQIYADLLYYDSSNNVLLDSGQNVITGSYDFDVNDQRRFSLAFSSTAPSGAVKAVARFIFIVNGTTFMGLRRLKVETGANASPYTSDSDLNSLVEQDIATSTALSSLTSTVTSQGGQISANSTSITNLNISVGDQNASISELYSVTGTINGRVTTVEAKAGLILNVNNVITGWILNNNGQQGNFDLLADTFRIWTSGGLVNPFTVSGNEVKMTNVTVAGKLSVDDFQPYQTGYENIKLLSQAVGFGLVEYINDSNGNYSIPYTGFPSGRQRFVEMCRLRNNNNENPPRTWIKNGTRTFIIAASASVDAYLSVWWQRHNFAANTWTAPQYVARSVDNASGVGSVTVNAAVDIVIAPYDTVVFFISVNQGRSGSNMWDAATGDRSITDASMTVTSVNF